MLANDILDGEKEEENAKLVLFCTWKHTGEAISQRYKKIKGVCPERAVYVKQVGPQKKRTGAPSEEDIPSGTTAIYGRNGSSEDM